jgi:hypothetical protein
MLLLRLNCAKNDNSKEKIMLFGYMQVNEVGYPLPPGENPIAVNKYHIINVQFSCCNLLVSYNIMYCQKCVSTIQKTTK